MKNYFVSRVASLIPSLFGISALVFFAMRILPGDPASLLGGESASPEDIETIRKSLNLHLPLAEQFWIFLKNFFSFSLGTSLSKNLPVRQLVFEALPYTLALAISGIGGALILAVIFSIRTLKNFVAGRSELMSIGLSIFSQSVPIFVLGPILVLVFSIKFGVTPVAGSESPWHLLLPALCLSISLFGGFYRYLSTSFINQLPEDYVRTARAKGLGENRIFGIHLLKNSCGPLVVVVSLSMGTLLGGAVVTETLFDWPGLGKLLFGAFQTRDFVLIQGIVVFTAFFHLGLSFVSDLILAILDPRMKLGIEK